MGFRVLSRSVQSITRFSLDDPLCPDEVSLAGGVHPTGTYLWELSIELSTVSSRQRFIQAMDAD